MTALRRTLIALAAIVVVAATGLTIALTTRPALEVHRRLLLGPAGPSTAGVRVTFAGVSTLLVDDGETALMIDGFFTRPPLWRTALWRIAPDRAAIAAGLTRLGVDRLAAVVVVHSHYDHAMDAPLVAARTGALLVGSASTVNVGRGLGLPEDRMHTVAADDLLRFGAFTMRLVPARHFPHGMAMGEIDRPLVPPARATAYREGGSYSVLIRHVYGTLLVHASAGWQAGALAGTSADVVLLGIAGLGRRDDAYRSAYWREIVAATGARLVIPIHWDDFTRSAMEPLRPLPRLLDDFDGTMAFLGRRASAPGAPRVGLLPPWHPVALLPLPPA